jgi:tRNA threonylcarbamoyladenosine biosynthesis protein TsaE
MKTNRASSLRLDLPSINTIDLGRVLGLHVQPGQVIALQGDLGAGKTTFTQGLAEGMGIEDHVTSPTFTLVNEYGSAHNVRLLHVDTYRLHEMPGDAMMEAATFGLEEILDPDNLIEADGGAVVVIEWAERVATLLPADHLLVRIEADREPQLRNVHCEAHGPSSIALLSFASEAFAA